MSHSEKMIQLKSAAELSRMREAGRVVAKAHEAVRRALQPGMTTLELDAVAENVIRQAGAVPSFKGYLGYPGNVCVSINEQVVHGIPGSIELQDGDIVSVDIGAVLDGFHGDSAWTYAVGSISPEAERLLAVTEAVLFKGIDQARPGNRLSDISHAVQVHAESQGYAVVKEFVGHGIGRRMHEEPQLPNFGPPGHGIRLKPGLVLAIEPMVNAGGADVVILDDQWTVVTKDGSLSAHFEHTVAVTENGPEILTLP